MSSINKSPPILKNCKSYNDWLKLLDIWCTFTSLEPEKQGPAIVLSLEEEAQEAVLELSTSVITQKDGVKKIITKLDSIYKKDELTQKYNDLESFENYKRVSNTTMREFLTEFEKRHSKVKSYGTGMTDDLLAFRLLKSANLTSRDEQLVKATISELKYDLVKSKLVKVFSDDLDTPMIESKSDTIIKSEPVFHASDHRHPDEDHQYQNEFYEKEEEQYKENNETFYTRGRSSFPQNRGYYGNNRYNNQPRYPSFKPTASNSNWRTKTETKKTFSQAKNPLDRNGLPTRCSICDSVNHWAHNCPDKSSPEYRTYVTNEVVLHQSDYDNPDELKYLMSETWSSAVLDCGASKTVCGKEWFSQFTNNLQQEQKDQIIYSSSNHVYRFGDGRKIQAIQCAKIPAIIGSNYCQIETDIIDGDIPLLFSKSSMKRGNMKINFQDDTITMLNENIPLVTTSSGHYAIPITKPKQIINNIERDLFTSVTLTVSNSMTDQDMAIKLHRQFAHPSQDKLIQLLNNAGEPWSTNTKLKDCIKSLSKECTTCAIYKKNPPRPIVGLPMATKFQETVAMDLKFYNGNIILHLIDHFSRLSASCIIPDKKPETIIQNIFKIWVSVYGTPDKFLSDNGGEFANHDFVTMCESLGITIKKTAAESPWSNGLVERHNLILSEMLDKVIADTHCNIEIAISWCVNAKNSLCNIHGFSPYQLVLGTNPKLPSFMIDQPPALTAKPTSKILAKNLEALHKARESFIACENSERIRRALSHNIRTSGDIKYLTGDRVYFKRANN